MERIETIKNWLKNQLNQEFIMKSASSDASFRRYFRIIIGKKTYILMDAPPNLEKIKNFINITKKLAFYKINVPKIISFSDELGLVLMSDFGSQTFLDAIDNKNMSELYANAINSLLNIQEKVDIKRIKKYSETLLIKEMSLFPEWYLTKLKNNNLINQDDLNEIFLLISKKSLSQNTCFVHRDFHSRNLMLVSDKKLGILDYQDALCGPLSYDLVSLLKDAYIKWDEEFVIDQSVHYWEKARKIGLIKNQDFSEFYKNFEWIGVQRHLKILGIFSRLSIRDKKDQYLKDIPLVEKYLLDTSERYKDLYPLRKILDKVIS
ncbi:MAG: aminoglycoside phosphotransferase [Nitrosomonadales bacterium]|nr:aminoglycoside phosphotransferase [Nitrosomonadales bacterium]